MFNFVEFTGEETEKEFLEKCLEQWERTTNNHIQDFMKILHLGTIFSEIRHRIEELD